ncbi:MAG: FAD-binding oxidoreductase [Mariprofundaceae bacterium]|nr:FAD-binding oxidoreductase [Mariprofundaceae bacterium]
MVMITYKDEKYTCDKDETVLACLLRHKVFVPNACQSGVCQSCMMKAVQGTPPHVAQTGLKDTLVAQNHFLACICKPKEDLEVSLYDASKDWMLAEVLEKSLLNESVVRLRLKPRHKIDYIAGQFINIKGQDGTTIRSYSLASLPTEDYLELHIKRVADGVVSNYLHDVVSVGDSLSIMGATGDCFYTNRDQDQPLLMIAIGTGLAPLYGVIRDALTQGHTGSINIYHGSLATAGLYYIDELRHLADAHPSVSYTPCVLHGDAPESGKQGDIQAIVKTDLPHLNGYRVYVCGDPQMVDAIKKQCFMLGASMADIYSDPFDFS